MTYAILGGGVSGLSAAYYLSKFGVRSKIILFEGSSHLGGWINSCRYDNGTVFELGPRTLRVAGNAGSNSLLLAQSLELEDKIISVPRSHPSAQNRMIKVHNKLHKLPSSLRSIFTNVPPFSKPLAIHLLKDLTARSVISNDESFFSFARRRFGSEVARYAVDPLCRGVFAGNSKDLSAMALGKRIYQSEQEYSSVIMGMLLGKKFAERKDNTVTCSLVERAKREKWSVWSLKGGIETLVEALQSKLINSNVEIIAGTQVLEINGNQNEIAITTDNGTHSVNKVISCLPALKLKSIVNKWKPELATLLNGIPYVSVGLVNLEYSGNLIQEPAFGYLIPSSESTKVLGVIYDSCIFPQENKTLLTVMMGGYWFKEAFGEDPQPETFLNIARNEVESTLGIDLEPTRHKVSILKNCIPQYVVGHCERVENIERVIKGTNLYLGGNSYYGVGVNDAIYATKNTIISTL